MFKLADLLYGPITVTSSSTPAGQLRTGLVNELRGRTYRVPVRAQPAVRLPRSPEVLGQLIDAALPPEAGPNTAVVAARALLCSPQRLIPLHARPLEHRLGLVVAIDDVAADVVRVGIAGLTVHLAPQKQAPPPDASLNTAWSTDREEAAGHLEDLWIAAVPAARAETRHRLRPAWWLGGSISQHPTLPADWVDQLEAVAAVQGFALEVIQAPAMPAVAARVQGAPPDVLLEWSPYTRNEKVQAVIARFRAARPSAPVISIDERKFRDAVQLARWHLAEEEERRLDEAVAEGLGHAQPATILASVQQAAREAKCCVFLPDAVMSAEASQFSSPPVVLAYLRNIEQVASRWRTGQLDGGTFEQAFIEVAQPGYRAGISQTAARTGDYDRIYLGRSIRLGPHLARGVGPVARILRIYWWADEETRTFVIGHVGMKLRDRSNP